MNEAVTFETFIAQLLQSLKQLWLLKQKLINHPCIFIVIGILLKYRLHTIKECFISFFSSFYKLHCATNLLVFDTLQLIWKLLFHTISGIAFRKTCEVKSSVLAEKSVFLAKLIIIITIIRVYCWDIMNCNFSSDSSDSWC